MRLLECQNDGGFRLTDNLHDNESPPYAILSHTWGQDCEEVTFEDMVEDSGRDKAGHDKIKFCAEKAAKDDLRYIWVDSCCIKKSSYSELTEAINSMFRWYRRAAKCYVYLSDVSTRKRKEIDQTSQNTWEPAFRESRWFTRGWTLQELLAPASVEFFSKEHERLGDKQSLRQEIHEITKIPISALKGRPLPEFSNEERMSWAAKRNTMREEDNAYSLLGIFDVYMTLVYGEGMENARCRLLKEIGEATVKKLLESLRFDQIDDRFMCIKQGHTKTCRWLLESTEYLDWMSADKLSEHHGFFWIKGKPGSGKSTLTKFALTEIVKSSRKTTILSFFFNARGSQLEKNTLGLYRSLLFQLLGKFPGSQELQNITNSINRRLHGQLKLNREVLKQILADALRIFGQHSITFVIDALDDCDEDEVRDMLAFFEMLGEGAISDGRTLHVLFSSRHYPHITIQRCIEMKLDHQLGHSQDIGKYLFSELKIGRGDLAEELRQEVRDRSSGIFVWIILVVQILNKAFNHGQVHSLRKKLREIPSDLTELFRTILTRDNQNLEAMKLCLQCVLFANRPLKREELYYAILSGTEPDDLSSWDPGTISTETMDLFILSSSKGLAEITKSKHHIVQFIHESVRDFLLRENGLGQLWTDLAANSVGLSQDRLKECCSNYMRSHIISDLGIDGDIPTASSPEADVLRKNASLQFPFLEYAVHNVFAHADIAHAEGVGQEFFVNNVELSNWAQLNNIVERYEVRRLPSDIDLLYVCAERNHSNLIGILMQHGLYTRGQNGRYHNPIFAAIANNCQGAFEALIKADSQAYPLRTKFPYPCSNIGSFLVKHGTSALIYRFTSVYDYDTTLKGGGTVLTWAAENGHTKIVEILLSQGADTNAQGGSYGSALQAASFGGYEKVVEILLSHGADINAQGGSYGSALQAASFGGYEKVVEILLSHGADINAQGGSYGSALQAASFGGYEKVVEILLSHGADINAQGGSHGNALQAASFGGYEKVVEILLSHGADINAEGGSHGNALQAASFGGYEKVVEILLSHGADINAQGGSHGNALQAASTRGHEKIINMLVRHGADINAQGGLYANALQAASAGAPTDSGYASITYNNVQHLSQAQSKDLMNIFDIVNPIDSSAEQSAPEKKPPLGDTWNEEDPGSPADSMVYSDTSLPASTTENYMSEFADELLCKVYNEELDVQVVKRGLENLPERLKAFAFKIGSGPSTQIHRDVMYFVLKHRIAIAQHVEDSYLHQYSNAEPRIGEDDKMSVCEKVEFWEKRKNGKESASSPVNFEGDDDTHKSHQLTDRINERTEDSDDDEKISPVKVSMFQDKIFENPSYQWLLASLRTELLLVPTEPNSMQAVRQKVMEYFELPRDSRKISKSKPAESYKMTFVLSWDPLAFIKAQEYEEEPHEAMERAITLTGLLDDAQALPCSQYLRQTWPCSGYHTIQLLSEVVRGGPGRQCEDTLPDFTKLTAWIDDSRFVVETLGTTDAIAEIGEQLAWIGAALRSSPDPHGVSYCTPYISQIGIDNDTKPFSGALPGLVTCNINFEISKREPHFGMSNGQCWHSLFRNPVVVRGYPIPRRSKNQTGIELPLSMMGKLAQTEQVDIFNRKIFIKGFSTMLVPTEIHEDLLIWHLLYEKDGGRISYLDSHDIHARSISISTLEASRHILGWCSEIRYNAGAINSSYTVESCGLKAPHEGCKLEDVYVSGGQLITGCDDSAVGSKDRRHQVSRNSYGEKLSWISKKYVVMWDVGDKRGWLVNGSSALLHLLRMSLETNKIDSLKSRFVFRAEAMKGSTEPIPSDFATDVLSNPINLNLEIHMDEDGVITPQTSSETLFPRRVVQSAGKHLRLKHRIERLYNVLEKMIDHQVGMAGQNGKLLRCRPRQVLEGWDFLDLATNEDPITPRVYKLRTRGKGWVDFTRAIHAITLFGIGFGEILQPVCESDSCTYWSTLPHGKYYLAAGIADLSRIMKRRGNHRVHPMRLTDYISWNFENTAFEPCQCRGQQQPKHSDLAQNLLPSSPSREIPNHDPVKLPEQGAVAFGHNDDSGFIWNDYGDPEQGNLPDSSDEPETEFDDSALGQSLSPPWSGTNRRMESFASDPTTTNDTTPNHKIGIVCALFTELMAVRTLFDETSEAPERADGDPNHYAFGRIGGHNVVAASLPCEDYGTNAAATVASHMLRSFPTITYCLVVGIGGGVPSMQHDIRLGDIVVSTGVIQYDIGKNFPNVEFRSTATIQRPHQDLTNVINEFRSNPKLSYVPVQEYIQHIQTSRPEYARPTQDLDRLFDSNYVHNRSRETCGSCDDPQVQREPRSSIWPSIHYGLIASGNSVVKDAQLRDRFKNEVLCFEMEAAGIMKTLQCLSIRGISDYADSHKNDLWQAYAAAAAAAYTKFFLTHIRRPNSLARQQTGLTATSTSSLRKREAPGQVYSTTSAKRYR